MIHESDSLPLRYFLKMLREHREAGNWKTIKLLMEDPWTRFDDYEVTWERRAL